MRFAQELKEPTFAPRAAIAGRDARTFARDVLAMDVEAYRAAFRGSAMKRAKLPAMKRNAAVVLGNVGSVEDLDVLTRALDDQEPLVREHAKWALDRIAGGEGGAQRHPSPDQRDAGLDRAPANATSTSAPGTAT